MIRKETAIAMVVLLVGVSCNLALAQAPVTADLTVDVANVVEYRADILDITKYARTPNVTPAVALGSLPTETPNFTLNTVIGDILAVNGQPAKGLFAGRARGMGTTINLNPGRVIADVRRDALHEDILEILQPDGAPIGSIMIFGMSGGPAPPGQPSAERGNWAIVGGTGVFLGARGQAELIPPSDGRAASMAEDPANRRINQGGSMRLALHIIPMAAPRIVVTDKGAAVFHSSDFAPMSPSRPATPGEILSLFATGLGPTVPGVASGQPFPSAPLAAVNSPVTVTVNGTPAGMLAAVGYPGSADAYQVNFRLPPDAPKGVAAIQVSVAWIAGTPVSITVQ